MPERESFDWVDSPEVVVRLQPSLAVYLNPYEHVVVLQESVNDDEDPFVTIAPDNVIPIVVAILTTAGRDDLAAALVAGTSQPLSPAARAKAYRERRAAEEAKETKPAVTPRTSKRDAGVTQRDGETSANPREPSRALAPDLLGGA